MVKSSDVGRVREGVGREHHHEIDGVAAPVDLAKTCDLRDRLAAEHIDLDLVAERQAEPFRDALLPARRAAARRNRRPTSRPRRAANLEGTLVEKVTPRSPSSAHLASSATLIFSTGTPFTAMMRPRIIGTCSILRPGACWVRKVIEGLRLRLRRRRRKRSSGFLRRRRVRVRRESRLRPARA